METRTLRIEISQSQLKLALAALFVCCCARELSSESTTLTTYYPAPSGVYVKMITTSDTQLARDGGAVTVGSPATPSRLKIVDGTQSAGYVFTSDANGLGAWRQPASPPAGASRRIRRAK